MTRAAAVTALLLGALLLPSVAEAQSWSQPRTVATLQERYAEPTPRVALAGQHVAVIWSSGARRPRVHVRAGTLRRLEQRQDLGIGVAPTIAVRPSGAAVAAFSDGRRIRVAVRRGAARRFGRPRAITTTTGRFDGANFAVVMPDGDRGWLVLYERSRRVGPSYLTDLAALRLSASGRPAGEPRPLGDGSLVERSVERLADGRVVALALRYPRPGEEDLRTTWRVLERPAGSSAFRTTPVVAPDPQAAVGDGSLTAAPDGPMAVGAVQTTRRGEAGAAGLPLAASSTGGAFAPFAGPPVEFPNRNFRPVAIPAAGDAVGLLWQQKTRPKAFDRSAPVVATRVAGGAASPPVTLSPRAAREPQAIAWSGGTGLAVWDDDGRWGAAEMAADGAWRRVAPPRGRPVAFHTARTNRDLQTSPTGRVAFVFHAAGRVVLTVRDSPSAT